MARMWNAMYLVATIVSLATTRTSGFQSASLGGIPTISRSTRRTHAIPRRETTFSFPPLSSNNNPRLVGDLSVAATTASTESATSKDGSGGGGSERGTLQKLKLALSKVGMISFILSMVVSLPLTLLPTQLLRKIRVISKTQSERLALRTGQFCARWSLRLFPFAKIRVITEPDQVADEGNRDEPSIWVCNHISMLDVFILLASDKKLRGPNKRPVKVVYWKTLENNPVNKIFFRMCGFIPIAMAPNAPGEDNQYDRSSFKSFLKLSKRALEDGFDIGILPEGQLNPHPETGLLPVFPGAYTLARMNKRPLRFLALHGTNHLWHATKGMHVVDNAVKVRAYPSGVRPFRDADDFEDTFERVVGHFGAKGEDLENWSELLME